MLRALLHDVWLGQGSVLRAVPTVLLATRPFANRIKTGVRAAATSLRCAENHMPGMRTLAFQFLHLSLTPRWHADIRASEPGAGGEVTYTLWLPGDDPNVLSAIRRPTHERDGFTLQVEWLRTSSRNHIPALFFRVERANHTLLFSHGNGTDIGQMFDFFVHLALTLKVSIFAYEYTGYGASSGSMPSERATIEDAEAAWHCVTQKYGVAPGRIVLYGQSVGSGPSCSLAARPEFGAAGLVLHSGMMSGLRVVMPVTRTFPVDPYPNIDLIKVRCAVPPHALVAAIHFVVGLLPLVLAATASGAVCATPLCYLDAPV